MTKRHATIRWSGAASALVAAMLAVPAAAQNAGETGASASSGVVDGNEIIVTARRREETLQDVPTAITAISSEALDSKAVVDIRALSGFIPNVNIQAATTSASASQIFIRGVGIDTTGFSADPNVGVYMDDIFIGRLVGSLVGAVDLERIEVLRGPQGTLYGRNSTAGAVKYVTRKPDLNENRARLSVTLGTNDRRTFRGSANLVLVPGQLGLLLSAQTRDEDGYIKLIDDAGQDTGRRANGVKAQDYRVALRYQPDDALTVDLAADYTRNRSGTQSLVPTDCSKQGPNGNGLQTGLVRNPAFIPGVSGSEVPFYINGNVSAGQFQRCPLFYNDPYASYVGVFPANDPIYDSAGVSGTIQYDLGFATLKSVTGYRGFRDIFASGLTGKPADKAQINLRQRLSQRQFQQELQLSSSGGGWIDYTVGLFYYHERINSTYVTRTGGSVAAANANAYKDQDTQKTDSVAGYGEVYIRPIENLELTIGGRFSHDHRTVDRILWRTPPFTTVTSAFQGEINSHKFTPKLGISYDTGPVLLYGTYSEGYRSPGYSSSSPASAADQRAEFGIESEKSYEVGFKSSLFDRLATINVAAFNAKYSNLQATLTINGQTVVVTSDVRIKGIEAEVSVHPMEGLTFFGNVGLLHGRYIKPPFGQPYARRLKHAPPTTFMIGGNYETSIGSIPGTFFIAGDLQYTSQAYRNVANTIDNQSDSYALSTARFGYKAEDDKWSLTFGGSNLFDKTYYLLGTQNAARSYQPGRRLFSTLEVNF